MNLKETGILPREKLLQQGASYLNKEELLAIILGRGIRGKDVLELALEVSHFLEKSVRLPLPLN